MDGTKEGWEGRKKEEREGGKEGARMEGRGQRRKGGKEEGMEKVKE